MSTIKIYKVRPWAKIPQRANPYDAGADLFYCPKDEDEEFEIHPRENVLIPTGIKAELPKGYAWVVCNKSSIASKKSLIYGAHVIDSGYNAEITVNLINVGFETQYLLPGQKIAQVLLLEVGLNQIEEVFEDTLNQDSIRGEKGFGSSGLF